MNCDEATARMVVHAHLEADRGGAPVESPVIAPERIADFRREWRRRPCLRALIRAAGRLDAAAVSRSREIRALWELARSREWAADGRGLLCEYPEFAELFDGEDAA